MYKIIGPDGQEYGPVELDVISQWIREGRVQPNNSVIDPIYGTARPAIQIPELESVFNSLPPQGQYGSQPPQTGSYQNPAQTGQYGQRPGPGPVNNPYGGPFNQQQNYPIQPGQPMYYQPTAPPKSKVAAFLLAFFLGYFGIHHFYLGNTAWGVAHLVAGVILGPVTCGFLWIIQGIVILIEAILILTGGIKDSSGQPLT